MVFLILANYCLTSVKRHESKKCKLKIIPYHFNFGGFVIYRQEWTLICYGRLALM